jgi:phospholipid transport system substrate-binding protein
MAADADRLQQLVDTKVHTITDILVDPTIERLQKDEMIIEIALEIIDFDLMATLSLGQAGWVQLNTNEQSEFITLYVERIKNSYLEKLYLYNGENVRIGTASQIRPTRIEVPTYFRSNDGEIEIRYKFYPDSERNWSIYDVDINGVSVVQTGRAQFGEFLENASVQELLIELRNTDSL